MSVCAQECVCAHEWMYIHLPLKGKNEIRFIFTPLETAPPGDFICVFWTSGKNLTRAIFWFIVKITSDTARTWQTARFLTHLLALSSSNTIQEYVLAWEPKNLHFHLRSASESMTLKKIPAFTSIVPEYLYQSSHHVLNNQHVHQTKYGWVHSRTATQWKYY